MLERPVVAITMGDPAGVGPELVAKCLDDVVVYAGCRPLVIADPGVMEAAITIAKANLRVHKVSDVAGAAFSPGEMDVLVPVGLELPPVHLGTLDAAYGEAGARCYRTAFGLAMAGAVQGIVSAPLNKEAFHAAGYHFSDELAYAADLTASTGTYILGVARDVWTIAVSEHVRFRDIADRATRERVLWCIEAMYDALLRAGIATPRIAVAALNVHGGEGGIFGDEEMEHISPAIADAQVRGIDAQGPIPADSVFPRAFSGEFHAVVCMYHDQANIARKLQPRSQGATIFLGLPVPCGTTAHGTAFDIAGKGLADPGSMAMALGHVAKLAAGA